MIKGRGFLWFSSPLLVLFILVENALLLLIVSSLSPSGHRWWCGGSGSSQYAGHLLRDADLDASVLAGNNKPPPALPTAQPIENDRKSALTGDADLAVNSNNDNWDPSFRRHSFTASSFREVDKGSLQKAYANGLLYPEEFYPLSNDNQQTTIIFNMYMGPPENLLLQLEMAANQKGATVNNIWVICFDSPMALVYGQTVEKFRQQIRDQPGGGPDIHITSSTYNFKFHGRFLLAYMAKSKYVLIVDDDIPLDETTVQDFIAINSKKPGVHGNRGHQRDRVGGNPQFIEYPAQPTEVDYLCGLWFFEQRILEAFFRERPLTWFTGEDIHLSHMARKYFGLRSYANAIGNRNKRIKEGMIEKGHSATTAGKPHELRHEFFRAMIGRGMIMRLDPRINTLVYVDTTEEALAFLKTVDVCMTSATKISPVPNTLCGQWLGRLGATTIIHRGRPFTGEPMDSPLVIEKIAFMLCKQTNCEFGEAGFLVPRAPRNVTSFNLMLGLGVPDNQYSRLELSDLLFGATGVFSFVRPKQVWLVGVNEKNATTSLSPYKKIVLQALDASLGLTHGTKPELHYLDLR